MNEVVMVVMLALVGVAAWAVLGPFQRGTAAVLERAGDPLEDERRRALRHLRDLDEDLAMGKLDAASHQAARADAEARAVAVLRALESREGTGELLAGLREVRERSAGGTAPPARWKRAAFAALAVAVVAAGTGLLLTSATRARAGGQTITGADLAAPRQPDQSAPLPVFEQRVREHPDDLAARLDLGRRYLDADKVGEATGQYLAALKLDPGNLDANTNLALLLLRAGLAQEALRSVNKALASDARYPEALYAKGLIELMGLRDPRAAVNSLRAYLDAAPFGAHRDTVGQLLQFAESGSPPPPGAAPAPTP